MFSLKAAAVHWKGPGRGGEGAGENRVMTRGAAAMLTPVTGLVEFFSVVAFKPQPV